MFEYSIVRLNADERVIFDVIEQLNKMGKKKWELVSVTQYKGQVSVWNDYCFKRNIT